MKYNIIPYAILAHISDKWVLIDTSLDFADAHKVYEAQEYTRKKLLNFGKTIREKDIAKEIVFQSSSLNVHIVTKADLVGMLANI